MGNVAAYHAGEYRIEEVALDDGRTSAGAGTAFKSRSGGGVGDASVGAELFIEA
jgi:hypothetical protein